MLNNAKITPKFCLINKKKKKKTRIIYHIKFSIEFHENKKLF